MAAVSLPLAMMSSGAASAAAVHPGVTTPAAGRMIPAIGNPLRYHQAGPAVTKNGTLTFSCQDATAFPECYGPSQIRAAYNVPSKESGGGPDHRHRRRLPEPDDHQ